MRPTRLMPVALVLAGALSAPEPSTPMLGSGEFQVNTWTGYSQVLPGISAGADGRFVVVWQSELSDGSLAGVAGRRFGVKGIPEADEFQVNQYTTGYQAFPAVGMGQGRRFLAAWHGEGREDPFGVVVRGFGGSSPLPAGDSLVSGYTAGFQSRPAVSGSPLGHYVVLWASQDQDGSGNGVFGRIVKAGGAPISGEFQANTYTPGGQDSPDVEMDETGRFVVVWQSLGQDGYGFGVFGRQFAADGSPAGPEFRVNSFALSDESQPALGMNAAGDFIVAWQRRAMDGQGSDIFARRYTSSGASVGGEFMVNATTSGFQLGPSVALDPFGNFAVAWQSDGQDGSSTGIFARIFDGGGLPVGEEFQVNAWTTGTQSRPEIVSPAAGDFVVVWQSYLQDGSGYGVFGRRFLIPAFCADGDADADNVCDDFDNCLTLHNPAQEDENLDGIGDECDLQVITPAHGGTVDCTDPALLRPTITWDPREFDRFRVFLSPDPAYPKGNRISSGDKLLQGTSWMPPGKKWRRACHRAAAANPGQPVLYIRVLGKDRDLPKSDPLRRTFSTSVQVDVLD